MYDLPFTNRRHLNLTTEALIYGFKRFAGYFPPFISCSVFFTSLLFSLGRALKRGLLFYLLDSNCWERISRIVWRIAWTTLSVRLRTFSFFSWFFCFRSVRSVSFVLRLSCTRACCDCFSVFYVSIYVYKHREAPRPGTTTSIKSTSSLFSLSTQIIVMVVDCRDTEECWWCNRRRRC
jgi:hypothetical protein